MRSWPAQVRQRLGRSRAVAVVGLMVGVLSIGLVGCATADRSPVPRATATVRETVAVSRPGLVIPHPLLEGREVPASAAVAELDACSGCPGFAAEGPGSPAHIVEAYVDDFGGIGFVLDDGTWMTFTPDSRTNKEYIEDWERDEDSDRVAGIPPQGFTTIALGDLRAVAHEHQGIEYPASISLTDAGHRWTLVGFGGATLDQLEEIARSMLAS